ncbi:hypothetical protein FRB90_000501 [Tulasnella sp. 427]|nr:hypothetical protein FRB90_000501 [Tulasnella sp. 427]
MPDSRVWITPEGDLLKRQELQPRRIHSDQNRICGNCFAHGTAEQRLLRCKASHWPTHKPTCKTHQQQRASAPSEHVQLQDDLKSWVRQNGLFLNIDGNSALLSHKDHNQDTHLLDTHILVVDIVEMSKNVFRVASARIAPHEELKMTYTISAGAQEYESVVTAQREAIKEKESLLGQPVAGIMWIVIWGHKEDDDKVKALHVRPLLIKQEIANDTKQISHNKDWVEDLISHTGRQGQKLYQTADGKAWSVVEGDRSAS